MSTITASTGLISGLDFEALTKALVARQQATIDRLNLRVEEHNGRKTGLGVLQANFLSISVANTPLKSTRTFTAVNVTNPSTAITATATGATPAGSYRLQAVQKVSTNQVVTKGFVNSDQKVGAGTITIAQGGGLSQPVNLDTLNSGAGVQRGQFRLTDRNGASATIDLSTAIDIDDVVAAVNGQSDAGIRASVRDDHLVLTDITGGSGSLTVSELNGGKVAADLGIKGTSATAQLTGSSILQVTGAFRLSQLNDGNRLHQTTGSSDLTISLADGTDLSIDLDDVVTLDDALAKINEHADNVGKLSATLTNGRLVLTDNTTGADSLTVANANNGNALNVLGLETAASGNVLTGQRLTGGLDSVLLRNLNGGAGIAERGSITLQDRSGKTATVDLSAAETLDDVLSAINAATDLSSQKLGLTATLNAVGNGIVITDNTGASAANLQIADVATGTVAADLGIAIDAASTSVSSGSLGLRHVNEATSLSTYTRAGAAVKTGSFEIRDAAGNVGVVSITSSVQTVGDVIQRINANVALQVTAKLNDEGDGFVLVDESGGSGTLSVASLAGGTTAEDLRLDAAVVTGGDGKQRISSRLSTVVEVTATDKLSDVVTKLNAAGKTVTASTFDDRSSFAPIHLSLTSTKSGAAGKVLIDTGSLDLGLTNVSEGQDAVLRFGGSGSGSSAFLLTSGSNQFTNVVPGLNVTLNELQSAPVDVVVGRDSSVALNSVDSFVQQFNAMVDVVSELTQYNAETEQRGLLQGDGYVLRLQQQLTTLVSSSRRVEGSSITSLAAVGVTFTSTGKLQLNAERFNAALARDPEGVKLFFTDTTNGLGAATGKAIDTLTDQFTGSFKQQNDSSDRSISELNERVETLQFLLEAKRVRLINQFAGLESILGSIKNQQEALSAFQSSLTNNR